MRHVETALLRIERAAACKALYAATLIACALLAALPRGAWRAPAAQVPESSATSNAEWPTEWDGRALRPLAPRAVEQRFAQRFPGAIARFDNGVQQIVLRRVDQPTRMLHPAADCYRSLGYRLEAERLELDARQRRWRCFDAVQGGERLRVCERIVDADGAAFTDASSWFWAALTGRSRGPWQAVTVARPG